MESLGKYLHELRLKRKISYEQVREELRFSEAQIRALEENRLSDIGQYGHVKAKVFNYARYLEADLNQVMAEFKIMMPEHTKQEFNPRKTLNEKKIMLSTNFLWTVGIVIFVGILGSILFNAYSQGWLKAPNLFEIKAPKEQNETAQTEKVEKPDSLRMRMLELNEAIPESNSVQGLSDAKSIPRDTTDYIGNILGKTPVNVQIN